MAHEPKRLVEQFFARFNEDPEVCLHEYVEDKELIEKIEMLLPGFPNHQVWAEDIVAEGEKVAVRARFQGVHKGELMGVPATEKQVDVPFFVIYRVENDKIVQHWLQMDTLTLMRQIGAGVFANLKAGAGLETEPERGHDYRWITIPE
jgi:predicted ester cyclase